jgi:hypothetical protein
VFTPELFFIESTPRDTIFHEMNWIQLKFKPEHIGRYYLRGYMHVPANNGEYNISPIETEINVVP